MDIGLALSSFDYSNPDSYATAAQQWGGAITQVDGVIKGVSATLGANGVAYPSPVAGPVAENPEPTPTFLAKFGVPLWAAVTGCIALVVGLAYLIFRK